MDLVTFLGSFDDVVTAAGLTGLISTGAVIALSVYAFRRFKGAARA